MSGSFWGGILLALVVVQVLVIWSIRRHRDPSLESTVRYLGIEVDDALEIAEQTDV